MTKRMTSKAIVTLTVLFLWMPVAFSECLISDQAIDTFSGGNLRSASGLTVDDIDNGDRKAVVLIHGWNPENYISHYNCGHWPLLIQALQERLADTTWSLQLFDWGRDAATGHFDLGAEFFGAENPIEAAENASLNGEILASKLSQVQGLRKVILIAHSAGAWAARRAAIELLKNPFLVVEVVLLDPFIPGQVPPKDSTLTTVVVKSDRTPC